VVVVWLVHSFELMYTTNLLDEELVAKTPNVPLGPPALVVHTGSADTASARFVVVLTKFPGRGAGYEKRSERIGPLWRPVEFTSTFTVPVPEGETAVSSVGETNVTPVDANPPNVTVAVEMKFEPLI